jgi:hypothetical protein
MVPNKPVLELHGLNFALWQLEPVLKNPFSLGSKANRCKCRLEQKTKALFSTSDVRTTNRVALHVRGSLCVSVHMHDVSVHADIMKYSIYKVIQDQTTLPTCTHIYKLLPF